MTLWGALGELTARVVLQVLFTLRTFTLPLASSDRQVEVAG